MVEPGLAACFVAVAEEQSFTRAANRLRIGQPQVSLRIRKLETQLGFALFARTTRQVELTPEATELLPYAQEIVRACSSAGAFLAGLANSRNNALRCGSPEATLTHGARTRLLNSFMDRYPAAQLEISSAPAPELLQALKGGRIEAVLNFRFSADGGRPRPAEAWQDVVAVQRGVIGHLSIPRDHPLSRRSAVALPDLAGHEIALPPEADCADTMGDIRAFLTRHAVPYRSAPDRATLQHFARTRRLPCFAWSMEERALIEAPHPEMVVLPIEGCELLLEFCLVTRRGDDRLPTRRLRNLAQELARQNGLSAAA